MSARATLVLASGLIGCGFHSTPGQGNDGSHTGDDDAPVIDAMVDATVQVDDGCLRDDLVTACLDAPPTAAVTLQAQSIDTGTSALCVKNPPAASAGYCMIAGATITIPGDATITVHGSKPLVLVSPGLITIAGKIDIAGHRSGAAVVNGAGVTMAACTAGVAPQGSGGGYGGSLGSTGGVGGADSSNKPGGTPASFAAPTKFRGGCPGQTGGNTGGNGRGEGGGAGGAIAVLSATEIRIDGTINAAGGGGNGAGPGNRGGGGGGSGGMIVIDAPVVSGAASARLSANGGSGGEAAGGQGGSDGNDPPDDPTARATGGTGGSSGGDGGAGAFSTGLDANAGGAGGTGTSQAGGGGGGGGVGVIRRYHATTALPGSVSPPAP